EAGWSACLLRPRPRAGAGRCRRRRLGKVPAPRAALPEQPHGLLPALPRLHVAPTRPRFAARARAATIAPDRPPPSRRGLSRLGRRGHGAPQPGLPPPAPCCRPRALPERILQALGG